MKTFFKDLWSLQKESNNFVKKHPLGTTVWCLASFVAGAGGPIVYYKIKNEIETRREIKKYCSEKEVEA